MCSTPSAIFRILVSAVCLCVLSACNTGIESTKKIKMSRGEAKTVAPSPESLLADSLKSEPLSSWHPGKKFFITDDKILLLCALPVPSDSLHSVKGRIWEYEGVAPVYGAGDEPSVSVKFKSQSPDREVPEEYRLNTRHDLASIRKMTGLDIPMAIDLDMVRLADSLLTGRKVWTKSRLRYSPEGNAVQGFKFEPVTISRVTAGNSLFPLVVEFDSHLTGNSFCYMGIRSASGTESRTFPDLFLLSDPKERYKNISEKAWDAICSGKLVAGMTKEECRLAMGTPSDVSSGHDWNATYDLWKYPDGSFLRFEDGLLVSFRQL